MIPAEAIKYKNGKVYLNGDKVSIDKNGNVVIEGDVEIDGDLNLSDTTNQSVAKIYYHPIYISDNVNENIRANFIILNNDPTPLTAATFLATIKSLMDNGALINITGCVKYSGAYYQAYIILKSGDNYLIFANNASTFGVAVNLDNVYNVENITVTDGVNAIN